MKAADENASALARYIGKTGLLRCERLSVEVTIADAKRSYSRTLLLVRPVSGEGEQWVEGRRGNLEVSHGSYLLRTILMLGKIQSGYSGGLAMTTVTISLPESLKEFIDRQIASKGYGNVSEYFRSLLREAQEREEDARLEALLVEGLASQEIPLTDEFWKDLRAEAIGIAEKHKARKRK
jgi:antitoxin ParD1/3/4